jgi:cytochrome P450 family 9
LEGDEWRHMRHNLSPAFTGSKLRSMMGLMTHTGRQFVKFLTTRTNPEEALDIREAFRRFATDVIATTAFGTVSDSVNDPQSEFYKNGKQLLNFDGIRKFIVLGYFISPKLMQLLKIKFMPEGLNNYFINMVVENIKYRELHKMVSGCVFCF